MKSTIQRLLKVNSVYPDEVAHYEPPHLDLHCFQNSTVFISGALRVKMKIIF